MSPDIPDDDLYRLWRNGSEVTPISELAATWSEVVNGVGQATVTIQNRDADPSLDFQARDLVKMTRGTWVLFEGEVATADLDLDVGVTFRRWRLGCTDWNTLLDTRLINCPDGQTWQVNAGGDANADSTDPNGPRVIDPDARLWATDRITVQKWYDAYVRAPDGGSFETDTYVEQVVPQGILFDGNTGEPNMVASPGPLRGALQQLAGMGAVPVYHWIDPDRMVHHQAFEGDYLAVAPVAPFAITDVRSEWDGTTKIGGRGLRLSADMTFAPEQVYVNASTPFVQLAATDPDIGLYGSRILYAGAGWGHSSPVNAGHSKSARQLLVDGQATTREQRDRLADTYAAFGSRPRYRGQITIGGRDDEGNGSPLPTGLRAGQVIPITDARLPAALNGISWPIQRLSGSLVANPDAPKSVIIYTIEFGDLPIGRFSERLPVHEQARTTVSAASAAPRHVIYFETLNPIPGSTQTLTSQARNNSDEPVTVKGIAVHWEITAVVDNLGNDKSGNGESVSPEDTVTDEHGQSITTFTAGSLTGVYYQIEASTPYQDI